MHLEAIISVKIGEYGSNLFMEINHIDKNTLSIAYNYIYPLNMLLNIFVAK